LVDEKNAEWQSLKSESKQRKYVSPIRCADYKGTNFDQFPLFGLFVSQKDKEGLQIGTTLESAGKLGLARYRPKLVLRGMCIDI